MFDIVCFVSSLTHFYQIINQAFVFCIMGEQEQIKNKLTINQGRLQDIYMAAYCAVPVHNFQVISNVLSLCIFV